MTLGVTTPVKDENVRKLLPAEVVDSIVQVSFGSDSEVEKYNTIVSFPSLRSHSQAPQSLTTIVDTELSTSLKTHKIINASPEHNIGSFTEKG